MPKDYSNTVIYRISCKDVSICESYVGHTVNFEKRKGQHERACNENKIHFKVYKCIRENGGWNNWEMVEIAKYNCKDLVEARIKEQYHYDELKPTLNSIPPFPSSEPHCEAKKVELFGKYSCDSCNYGTCRKSQYDRHIVTSKHMAHLSSPTQKQQSKQSKFSCPCGAEYKERSGLWRHNKVCKSGTNSITEKTPHEELIVTLIHDNNRLRSENTLLRANIDKLAKERDELKVLLVGPK
jgi:hypothetical protein